MANILDANSLRAEINEELVESYSINLLSAYVTTAGVNWLIDVLPADAKLTVVGRFIPRDFKTGASEIEAIRTLLAAGHTVKALGSLHAKILTVDDKTMFLGSANYTARGLGLIEAHNLEASVKLELSPTSQKFISNVIKNALNITSDILDQFEEYLLNVDDIVDDIKGSEWPVTLFESIDSLYVKDFPLSKVSEDNEIYTEYPDSDYSRLYESRNNYTLSRSVFRSSRSYIWLIQILSQEENLQGVSFGRLSSLMHDALLDDPAPYRRTVKDLQLNFYSYIKVYADDVVQFYTPGARSEFIKLYK